VTLDVSVAGCDFIAQDTLRNPFKILSLSLFGLQMVFRLHVHWVWHICGRSTSNRCRLGILSLALGAKTARGGMWQDLFILTLDHQCVARCAYKISGGRF